MEVTVPEHPGRAPSRRGALKLSALLAVLLMALVALNAPITFAGMGGGTATVAGLAQTTESTDSTDATVADVAEQSNPATVTVLNLQQIDQFGPFGDDDAAEEVVPVGSGSGYIIDEAGHVVTNAHVVAGGIDFQVQLYDGTVIEATLVGADEYQDVAVLQLELADGQTVPGTVAFGDSDAVRVGDTVVAIGSPFGRYTNTVTSGIVNGVDRALDTGYGYLLPNLVQHDAEIYPGNSGGPLLNSAGEVIGMNVAKAVDVTSSFASEETVANIGFAIESNAIESLVEQIIATGKVARPYLGIRAQPTVQGQGVMSVETDGPAADAGLQPGDVITEIDGQEIDVDHPFINELIFNHQPGETVSLTVERDGDEVTFEVTLGERPAATA